MSSVAILAPPLPPAPHALSPFVLSPGGLQKDRGGGKGSGCGHCCPQVQAEEVGV